MIAVIAPALIVPLTPSSIFFPLFGSTNARLSKSNETRRSLVHDACGKPRRKELIRIEAAEGVESAGVVAAVVSASKRGDWVWADVVEGQCFKDGRLGRNTNLDNRFTLNPIPESSFIPLDSSSGFLTSDDARQRRRRRNKDDETPGIMVDNGSPATRSSSE